MKNFKSLTVLFLSAAFFGFAVSSAHALDDTRYAQIYTHDDNVTRAATHGSSYTEHNERTSSYDENAQYNNRDRKRAYDISNYDYYNRNDVRNNRRNEDR